MCRTYVHMIMGIIGFDESGLRDLPFFPVCMYAGEVVCAPPPPPARYSFIRTKIHPVRLYINHSVHPAGSSLAPTPSMIRNTRRARSLLVGALGVVRTAATLAPVNVGSASPIPGLIGGAAAGAPAVIVIQEWWGITDTIKAHAEKIAEEGGFRVFVPDVYKGQLGVNVEEANHLIVKSTKLSSCGQGDFPGSSIPQERKERPRWASPASVWAGRLPWARSLRLLI